MKQAILDKVEESFKKAEAYYGRTFSRPKHIIFKRTGTNGGHCWYERSELMFQISLAEKEGDKFVNRTPAHEVAHWIDKEVNGYSYTPSGRRDIHGKKWKFIMTNVMGLEASRCHSYDVSDVAIKRKRYDYACSNGHTLSISSVKHNRIVNRLWRNLPMPYRCKCGGKLSLKVKTREDKIKELEEQIKQLTNAIN